MPKLIATLILSTSLVLVPTTATADVVNSTDTSCEADYWKAAYERADAEAMSWMQDYYQLGNLVDAANRKIDRQRDTINRLRAKLRKHGIGPMDSGLDFTTEKK